MGHNLYNGGMSPRFVSEVEATAFGSTRECSCSIRLGDNKNRKLLRILRRFAELQMFGLCAFPTFFLLVVSKKENLWAQGTHFKARHGLINRK